MATGFYLLPIWLQPKQGWLYPRHGWIWLLMIGMLMLARVKLKLKGYHLPDAGKVLFDRKPHFAVENAK